MTDRPIIFSAPMVRALLDGRKTQTRRLIRTTGHANIFDGTWTDGYVLDPGNADWRARFIPYAVYDRLWVREAHYLTDDGHEDFAIFAADENDVREHLAEIDSLPANFTAELRARHRRLRPSIHMPRWASRLTLHVTDIRVQRLQEISREDVIAEGVSEWEGMSIANVVAGWHQPFAVLWDSLHGSGAWNADPWVVAISLTVERANIDRATSPSKDQTAFPGRDGTGERS
ncbi:hypothetical protein [uncultured Enterovirga sp.]|uniref:hypothetical protein n=1 Tax=uncultured Enterovirga sp. TaxID=2026352 RepID=UPI0035CBEA4B